MHSGDDNEPAAASSPQPCESEGESQYQNPTLRELNNKQTSAAAESKILKKVVAFGKLLPVIQPHLDKDEYNQLQTLYSEFRKKEICTDVFERNMRNIVGERRLKQGVDKLMMQQTQTSSQQQQHVKMASLNVPPSKKFHPLSPFHQKGQNGPTYPSQVQPAMGEVQRDYISPTKENNAQKQERHHLSASQEMYVNEDRNLPMTIDLNLPHASFPMHTASMSNHPPHPYRGKSVGASSTSVKPQFEVSQILQSQNEPQTQTCSKQQQHVKMASLRKVIFSSSHQKGQNGPTTYPSQVPPARVEVVQQRDFISPTKENNAQKQESDHLTVAVPVPVMIHLHLPKESFPVQQTASMSDHLPHPYQKGCDMCGIEGHIVRDCPWIYTPCNIRGCCGLRKLMSCEETGKKFLSCHVEKCGGFEWLEDAILLQSKGGKRRKNS